MKEGMLKVLLEEMKSNDSGRATVSSNPIEVHHAELLVDRGLAAWIEEPRIIRITYNGYLHLEEKKNVF